MSSKKPKGETAADPVPPSLDQEFADAQARLSSLQAEQHLLPDKMRAALQEGDEATHRDLRAREALLTDELKFAVVRVRKLHLKLLGVQLEEAQKSVANFSAEAGRLSQSHFALRESFDLELRASQHALDTATAQQRGAFDRVRAIQNEITEVHRQLEEASR